MRRRPGLFRPDQCRPLAAAAAAATLEGGSAAAMPGTVTHDAAAVSCARQADTQAELIDAAREHLADLALADRFHPTMPAAEVLGVVRASRARLALALEAMSGR